MTEITHKCGRIALTMQALPMGADYVVLLTGGAAHVGAAALALPGAMTSVISARNHKDSEPASIISSFLADNLGCRVACICGIHLDLLTADELASIRAMITEMAKHLLELLIGNKDD